MIKSSDQCSDSPARMHLAASFTMVTDHLQGPEEERRWPEALGDLRGRGSGWLTLRGPRWGPGQVGQDARGRSPALGLGDGSLPQEAAWTSASKASGVLAVETGKEHSATLGALSHGGTQPPGNDRYQALLRLLLAERPLAATESSRLLAAQRPVVGRGVVTRPFLDYSLWYLLGKLLRLLIGCKKCSSFIIPAPHRDLLGKAAPTLSS